MAQSADAPHQYAQPSRKGKRAWRKNVDISEVQAGLENVREEVTKGGVIAEKPSDVLFALDVAGSEQIRKTYRTQKPLKADEILAQRSAVPAVESRKRSRVTDGVIEPSSKRKKGGVSNKEYTRLQNIAFGGNNFPKDVVKTDGAPEHDPWSEQESEKQDPKFSYLDKPKPVKAPKTLKQAPVSLLESTKTVPAVIKPKASISYNPAYQDWDQLLKAEGEKEVAAERQRIEEAEAEQRRQDRIAIAQAEKDDVQTEDESAWEGFESEYDGDDWLGRKRAERKTPAERNKVKRRKEAERQVKHEAQMKKRDQQTLQIKAIAQQVEAKERAKATSLLKEDVSSEEEIDDRTLRRRKLGKITIPPPPLELVLPDELQESLRLLKPEGNLLKDRFRSIMLRGKIEARRPITQPKKARRAYTEKWTYKDFKVPAR